MTQIGEQFEELQAKLKIFNGYLSADAEIKYFESGKCKTSFSIPLKENKEDEAKWLNCECWGRIAEKCSEFKKGDEVIVLGFFKEVEYENKDKEKVKKIMFVVKGAI